MVISHHTSRLKNEFSCRAEASQAWAKPSDVEVRKTCPVNCNGLFCGDLTFSDIILTVRGTPQAQCVCREPESGPRRQEGAARMRSAQNELHRFFLSGP